MLIENDPECAIIGEAANRAAMLEAARLQPDIIILSIFDKLKVADRLEIAVYAFRHGLAKLPSKPLMQETSTAKDWMQL